MMPERSNRSARKPSLLPDPGYASWDSFPGDLWRFLRWDEPASRRLTPEELPSWMSAEACQEVLDTCGTDTVWSSAGRLDLWWRGVWETLGPYALTDPEALMMTTAMAACVGWPVVAEQLRAMGAPIGVVSRPANGWRWMEATAIGKQRDCSVLELCVNAMCGEATTSVFHPRHRQALEGLLNAGADPNTLTATRLRRGLCYGPIAKMLIAHGLDPWLKSLTSRVTSRRAFQVPERTDLPIVCELFEPDLVLSSPGRRKVLEAFLEHGLPLRDPSDGKPLLVHMTRSVHGLRLLDLVLERADRNGLAETMNEAAPLLERRLLILPTSERESAERMLARATMELRTPAPKEAGRSLRL